MKKVIVIFIILFLCLVIGIMKIENDSMYVNKERNRKTITGLQDKFNSCETTANNILISMGAQQKEIVDLEDEYRKLIDNLNKQISALEEKNCVDVWRWKCEPEITQVNTLTDDLVQCNKDYDEIYNHLNDCKAFLYSK